MLAVLLIDGVGDGCTDGEAAAETLPLIEPVAAGVVLGDIVIAALTDMEAEIEALPDGVAVASADAEVENVTEPDLLRDGDVELVALPATDGDTVALAENDGEPLADLVIVSTALTLAEPLRVTDTEPESLRELLRVAVGDFVGVRDPVCDGGDADADAEPLPERDTLAVALLLAALDRVVDADGGSDALTLSEGVLVELTVGDGDTLRVTEELAVSEAAKLGLALEDAGTLADAVSLADTDGDTVTAAVTDELIVGEREALRDRDTDGVAEAATVPLPLLLANAEADAVIDGVAETTADTLPLKVRLKDAELLAERVVLAATLTLELTLAEMAALTVPEPDTLPLAVALAAADADVV